MVLGKWYLPNHYKAAFASSWGNSGPFPVKNGWEHRPPGVNINLAAAEFQNGWHRDNFGDTEGLLVWSNILPTEVRLPDGNVVSPEENDVVLIANHLVEHRISKGYIKSVHRGEGHGRHFLRASTNKYPSKKTIAAWKRTLAELVTAENGH